MKKKTWLIILAIVLLLISISLIIAPGIIRNSTIKNSKVWMGRQIDLQKLKVNYFTGTVKLIDFKMFEPDDHTVFASIDTLLINIVPYRLLSKDLVIQQLYIKGLYTSVVQNDTLFNFDDLIAFHAATDDSVAIDTTESAPMRFEMSDFELKQANIKYHDLSINKVHDLNDINFFVPYISWDQEASSEAGLKFNFKNEGFFQSSIKVDPLKGDFDANVEINLLQLNNFTDYLKKYISIESLNGLLNTKINIKGNIDQPDKAIVSGLVNLMEFNSIDTYGKEFLRIDNLDFYLNKIDAGNMDFIIDSIHLDNPYLYFDLNDSSNNIFEIMHYDDYLSEDSLAITDETEPINDTAPTMFYAIKNISLTNGNVDFVDNLSAEAFNYKLSEINVKLDEINSTSSTIGDASKINLDLLLNDESEIHSEMNVEINFGAFDANFYADNLNISTFEEYAKDYMNIGMMEGLLKTGLSIHGNINEPEKVILSGEATLKDFYATDRNMWTFASASSLDFHMNKIDADNMEFLFDSVILHQPYIYFEMYDSTNNIFDVLGYADDSDEVGEVASDQTSTDDLMYAVNLFRIDNGRLEFVDNTTSESFVYPLSEIAMKAENITTEVEWVNTYSKMLLNDRGKLNAEFGFNPSNPMDFKLEYVITDFLLSDLNIYSRHYMGFPILYGDMYYKSETELLSGLLKSENQLVINNVELGDKGGGLYSLPIKFALFLLKDKDGVINLDVPVRGDLNDPQVNVGKIVWTTFKNLIIKVASSPVQFLSGLLSVDPKDIQEIQFNYLDTTFTEYRQKQLDLLLELEQKKPGLEIEMVYFNDVEMEKEQIAIAEAGKWFEAETGMIHTENEIPFTDFLHKQAQNDSLSAVEASFEIIPLFTLDSIAEVFAAKRLEMLESYIKMNNDSSTIKTFIPNIGAPKNIGSKPVFEIKYSIN